MQARDVSGDITQLLAAVRNREKGAEDNLLPLIYSELRRLARLKLRHERSDHTLQATALVHEAYVRLLGQEGGAWQNRAHFFGVASRVMRQILIDYARQRKAKKRGGTSIRVELSEHHSGEDARTWDDLLDLDSALSELSELDERRSRVVEMRFFGGLDPAQIAEALGVSTKTVKRDWDFAQAWLFTRISRNSGIVCPPD